MRWCWAVRRHRAMRVSWWAVVAPQPVDGDALRHALAQQLPAHMVPVAIVQLEALPLSSNGKLDRKALPLPQCTTQRRGAPLPGLESTLAAAFCRLLACDDRCAG